MTIALLILIMMKFILCLSMKGMTRGDKVKFILVNTFDLALMNIPYTPVFLFLDIRAKSFLTESNSWWPYTAIAQYIIHWAVNLRPRRMYNLVREVIKSTFLSTGSRLSRYSFQHNDTLSCLTDSFHIHKYGTILQIHKFNVTLSSKLTKA